MPSLKIRNPKYKPGGSDPLWLDLRPLYSVDEIINSLGDNVVEEANKDNILYGRKNGKWEPVANTGFDEEQIKLDIKDLKDNKADKSLITDMLTKTEASLTYLIQGEYALKTEVTPKADKTYVDLELAKKLPVGNYLTEHLKLKTLNGESLIGEGDIEVTQDSINVEDSLTSNSTTDALSAKQGKILKGEIDSKLPSGNYALKSDISDMETKTSAKETYQPIGNYLEEIPAEYATQTWVGLQGFLKEHLDISNLATKGEVSAKLDKLVSGQNISTINNLDITTGKNISIKVPEIVDTLESNDAEATLSANLGRVIKSLLDGKLATGDYALKSEIPDTTDMLTKTLADKTYLKTGDYVTNKLLADKGYLKSVPKATKDTIGGIKIGTGFIITPDGTLNATGGGGVADSIDWSNVLHKPTNLADWNAVEGETAIANKPDVVLKTLIKRVATTGSYKDLSDKPTIPTALSLLTEDASHKVVTDTEKLTWNNKSNFDGNYNNLSNLPTIPSKVSQLENDNNTVTDSSYVHTDNNYTTLEKDKLKGIESGALKNPISLPANGGNSSTVNGHSVESDVPLHAKFTDTTYEDATTEVSGLMSGIDKTKLNTIEEGAQVNKVTSVAGRVGAVTLTKTDITDFPESMPASDVKAWAKAETKPTYTADEVGLGNVNNTSDADKPISTATKEALDKKIEDAPINTKLYARLNGEWSEIITSGGVLDITDIPSQKGDTITQELFSKIEKAYNNRVLIASIDGEYQPITIIKNPKGSSYSYVIIISLILGISNNTQSNITIINSTVEYSSELSVLSSNSVFFTLENGGDGSKALMDNGEYISIPTINDLNKKIDDVTEIGKKFAREKGKWVEITETNYPLASTSINGLMSSVDKTKLNGIEVGALKNKVNSVAGKTGAISLVKADVGLENVDNTSDMNKPVSEATKVALDLKLSDVSNGNPNSLYCRRNGEWVDAIQAIGLATEELYGFMGAADKLKLDSIGEGYWEYGYYGWDGRVPAQYFDRSVFFGHPSGNISLSMPYSGAEYNGINKTVVIYTTDALTITIPNSGNYVSMCGTSYKTKSGEYTEFNFLGVSNKWHISMLTQK